MPGSFSLAASVAIVLTLGGLAVAQDAAVPPVGPAPDPAVAPPATRPSFPVGAEVLSVDGELLGVLVHVETGDAGEQTLHVRAPGGQIRTAPAKMASRGERAVVLEWTRAEFETSGAAVAPPAPL